MNPTALSAQLDDNRRTVAFDSYDLTVRQLRDMVLDDAIDIAPDYQRHFVWDSSRQSQLIESLFLGIPVPSLFMATNKDSTWEVIDGLQRMMTILNFSLGANVGPSKLKYFKKLKIENLEKLSEMNGSYLEDLPSAIQRMFETRPVRVTVLNDRSDFGVRYDLFERLNTGGIALNAQEIRNCIFLGEFSTFIKGCASKDYFRNTIKMSKSAEKKANLEELALKFFAYFEDRSNFKHSVVDFLNEYMKKRDEKFSKSKKEELSEIFEETFNLISEYLPGGIVRSSRSNTTPLVLYEAISVGVADLLSSGSKVSKIKLRKILDDETLKEYTTGATNSKKRLEDRIEYVKANVLA
jgi:hypothetical protein